MMLCFLENLFGKKPRKPADKAELISLSGAVLIFTADGNVVLEPSLARQLVRTLPAAIVEAETGFARPEPPAIL